MKDVQKSLQLIGYNPEDNLIAYWFENENKCIQKLDSDKPSWGQRISTQLRWQTELGSKLAEEVKEFINSTQERARQEQQSQCRQGDSNFVRAIIDFNKLKVTFDKETKHINEWLYTISNKSTFKGRADLRGIDLRDISIRNAILMNACFANSNFYKSKFNQVTISNCTFQECDFSDSFLAAISIDERVEFSNSNFSGATVNAISLGANCLGTRPKIREVSYLNLFLTAVTGKKSKIADGHTDFSCIEMSTGANGEEQKHLSYISWYQDTMLRYTEKTDFVGKQSNIISALTTKNWRSLWAVLFTAIASIILFATAYFFLGESGFNKPFPSFMSAIYYSVVTFSTLGYGDIIPNTNNNVALMLVMLEVFIGYTLLAVFIFVLSNRVNDRKP